MAFPLVCAGEGNATIAGGQGTMWTTALQIGELIDTAQRVRKRSSGMFVFLALLRW